MDAKSFGIALDDWAKDLTGPQLTGAVQKIALDLLGRVVMRTPVDSGRLRANWSVSINYRDMNIREVDDKLGSGTIAAGRATIASMKVPQVVYLQNNLPYVSAIENGHSRQAPIGMLAVSLAELQSVGWIRRI